MNSIDQKFIMIKSFQIGDWYTKLVVLEGRLNIENLLFGAGDYSLTSVNNLCNISLSSLILYGLAITSLKPYSLKFDITGSLE